MSTSDSWTIKRLLEWTTDYFKKNGIDSPRLEAEILLAFALKFQRIELYTHFETEPTEEVKATFRAIVKRRAAGEPVAYLVGYKEFYSLRFFVNRDVLIPRPETEQLVLEVLDWIKNRRKKEILPETENRPEEPLTPENQEVSEQQSFSEQYPSEQSPTEQNLTGQGSDEHCFSSQNLLEQVSIKQKNSMEQGLTAQNSEEQGSTKNSSENFESKQVSTVLFETLSLCDIGTGSGIIPITLLKNTSSLDVTAVDISPKALETARRNAQEHKVGDQIQFVESDLFAQVPPKEFDVIVSNPPYVSDAEFQALPKDVALFEPSLALLAGKDGLDIIARLIPQAKERLKSGGALFLETSPMNIRQVKTILETSGHWKNIQIRKDFSSQERFVLAEKSKFDKILESRSCQNTFFKPFVK